MCRVQSGELLEDNRPGLALLRGVVNARDGGPHFMVSRQVGNVHPPPLVPRVLKALQAGTALSKATDFKCHMVGNSFESLEEFAGQGAAHGLCSPQFSSRTAVQHP